MDDLLDQFMEDHINGGYGDVLDELAADEFARDNDHLAEPWDHIVAQQELEDFEQTDEYFGYYGDEYGDDF